MKIGRFEIRMSAKPSDKEIGGTGTKVFSGDLSENEYNTELRGQKGIAMYDKMRRSDGQVCATVLACQLPILAAKWTIEPASEDQRDIDVATFVEANLMNQMTITWQSFLEHVLLMMPFGFMVFEKVWEIVDNAVRLRKLAPRLPQTIYYWGVDRTGGLESITQYVVGDSAYKQVVIPVDKLLVFTNRREGSDYAGMSILRAAYKHWYYKDGLYRLNGVAAERHATGVPTFRHDPNATDVDKANMDKMGQHLQAHERQYVRVPNSTEFTIEGLTGSIMDLMPSIEHHNRMIAVSILNDFLAMGSGDKGSYALSRDKSSFFLMALESVVSNICETVNRYLIPQLVDYNFTVDAYPKLKATGLETREIKDYCDSIVALVNAGTLTNDPDIEDTLRDMLHLPEKKEGAAPIAGPTPEETPANNPVPPNQPAQPQGQPAQPTTQHIVVQTDSKKFRRALTAGESFIAFDEINGTLDGARQRFVDDTKDIMTRQIDNLVEVLAKIIEKREVDKLADIDIRYRTEMATKMAAILKDILAFGRQQVKKELVLQKKATLADPGALFPYPLDADGLKIVMEFLKARAKNSAATMANKIKTNAIFEALHQIKNGIVDTDNLKRVLKDLSDRELVASADFSINEAFNFGRSIEAEKEKDDIETVQYSAILDSGTCKVCEPLDGQEWDFSDERTGKYYSGNPDCEGGNRCRCLLVFIRKSESKAVR